MLPEKNNFLIFHNFRKKAAVLAIFSIIFSIFISFFKINVASVRAEDTVELLKSPWNLQGSNGASEAYQAIDPKVLQGKDILRLTYNLHGLCALDGDASAVIFDQPFGGDWRYISLSKYGRNCHDGVQSIDIPLSRFPGLNLSSDVGTFHTRFWHSKPFNIDITSAVVLNSQSSTTPPVVITPTLIPTGGPIPTPTVTPTPTPIADGFLGEYFTNQYLSGQPGLTRTDKAINFTWNHSSPDPSLPSDRFSVRWTKMVNFSADTYEFSVTADDGVRLYIDGIKVIDKWIDQPATNYKTKIAVAGGSHQIKMEYYEKGGGAVAKMSYAPVSLVLSPTPTPLPTSTPAPIPVSSGSSWAIQSVSSMKETKDKVCNQDSQAFINAWVDKAKELGVNYVAVETPYENPACGNALTYTKAWVDAIRSRGLKVWHRHMPLAHEGIYSTPKARGDYYNTISNYIKNNPSLFQEGDIFTPIPEPQNGGVAGITYCASGVCQYDNPAHFNRWLRDAMDVSENAFSSVGMGGKMKIGYYGFDGFVAWGSNNPDWNGILEDATVAKMGNITIDHYPELIGQTMKQGLDEVQARYPGVPIILGEWGSTGTTNLEQQVLNSMGAAKRPGVIGFNYWHMGMGGNEALINGDFTNRQQFDEVQSFFKGIR